MILSVSRRTDIPALYSDWFLERIQAGYVYVPNPMNTHQISRVSLSPEVIDCIVFWSKNPAPLLPRLAELDEYHYYFQFTLNAYGQDLERNLPPIGERIDTFRRLSETVGPDRVIWRYDPIIISEKYPAEYHEEAFQRIAERIGPYTRGCVISFVDTYRKLDRSFKEHGIAEPEESAIHRLASGFSRICFRHRIFLETCAEKIDLAQFGIGHSHCIDRELIEKILGKPIESEKDKNQREECGCIESVDVGMYNTCTNGCAYCYANYNRDLAARNHAAHNPDSPMLIGAPTAEDRIAERKVRSQILRGEQTSIFEL
jgi:DNA repair photolyase